MLEETCLNRFLNRCKDCTKDYDLNHHPNNYDCKYYKSMKIMTHIVEEENKITTLIRN
jgi:hypothetical protein